MPYMQSGRFGLGRNHVSEEKEEYESYCEEDEHSEEQLPSSSAVQEEEETTTASDMEGLAVTLDPPTDDTDTFPTIPPISYEGKLKTVCGGCIREEHPHPIYAIAWSTDVFQKKGRYYRVLASVAGRNASLYEVEIPKEWTPQSRTGKFRLVQSYYDPTPKEDLYACAFGGRSFVTEWTRDEEDSPQQQHKKIRLQDTTSEMEEQEQEENDTTPTTPTIPLSELDLDNTPSGPQFLCVGGKCFNIKVIDTARRQLWMTLSGHGEEITQLKFSPADPNLLLSASNDRSCRIWNVRNGTCVAILAGHHGHQDIVMSAAWHCDGTKIVSGSHDTLVKIWNVGPGTKSHDAMRKSYRVPLAHHENGITVEARDYHDPVTCQFPIFSTHKVHYQPVDCVEFVGDLVLSKASNKIVLWDPDYSNPDGNPNVTVPPPQRLTALRTLDIQGMGEDVMFYRFGTSMDGRFVSVGNMDGKVLLFDLDDFYGKDDKVLNLRQQVTMVRMTSFSPDGRILLCCCDDGGIWKWDCARR